MKLHIDIELGNEEMQTGNDVMKAIRSSRLSGTEPEYFSVGECGKIRDTNGNVVGEWVVKG